MTAAMSQRATPLTKAAKISKRRQPKVRWAEAGRPESQKAKRPRPGRRDVGQHVPGVGEESQAVAQETAGRLDDEHGRRDDEGDGQGALRLRMVVIVGQAANLRYIFSRAAMRSSMGGWVLKSRLIPLLRSLSGLTM